MANSWKEYSLEELCLKITDGSHQSPKSFEGGFPMYSVKDMNDHGFNTAGAKTISEKDYEKLLSQGCQPELNDILIAKDGSVMKHVFKVSKVEKCALLSSIAILKPRLDIVDPDYLVFSILNPLVKNNILSNYVSGSGVPRIVLKDFKKVKLTIPDLKTQRTIAKVLLNQNEKIILSKKTNKTLEQVAKVIFKSWFVDFDPVIDNALDAGKQIGDFPEPLVSKAKQRELARKNEDYKSLPDAIKKLFPNEFVESDLGWIPKGWSTSTIGETCSHIIDHRGKTPKKLGSDWAEEGFAAISAKNIKGNQIVRPDTIRYVDEDLYAKWMKEPLQPKDIIMTSEAPMGEMYFLAEKADYLLSQRLYGMRADKEKTTGEYLNYWLQTVTARADLEGRATGTTVTGIRQVELKKVAVLLPELTITQKFSEIVGQYLLQKERNYNQISSLEETRDYLLPNLISGKVQLDKAV